MPVFTSSIELSDDYPSIQPSLNLNFAGSRALDPRITFTRSTVGTYVDKNGLFKTAGKNEPRFDHDPVTLESLGLLIEKGRTNHVTNSTSPSSWFSVASAVDETTYPIKGLATTRLTDSPVDGDSPYLGAVSWGTGSSIPLCMSIYVDAVNSTSDTITLFLFGAGYINHSWNISTGVPVASESFSINGSDYNSGSQEVIDCGGGIYRLILKANFTGSLVSGACRFYLAPSGGATDYVIIAGPQIEQGAFPTSYIPTSGSSITADTDDFKISGTSFESFINKTEGTLMMEYKNISSSVSTGLPSISDGTGNRYMMFNLASEGSFSAATVNGGSVQANLSVNITSASTEFVKAIFAVKENDFALTANGQTPVTDTSGTLFATPTQFTLEYATGGNDPNAHFKSIKYYPKRLPNAQLQLLTSQKNGN